jgi:hypothetical protein
MRGSPLAALGTTTHASRAVALGETPAHEAMRAQLVARLPEAINHRWHQSCHMGTGYLLRVRISLTRHCLFAPIAALIFTGLRVTDSRVNTHGGISLAAVPPGGTGAARQ